MTSSTSILGQLQVKNDFTPDTSMGDFANGISEDVLDSLARTVANRFR